MSGIGAKALSKVRDIEILAKNELTIHNISEWKTLGYAKELTFDDVTFNFSATSGGWSGVVSNEVVKKEGDIFHVNFDVKSSEVIVKNPEGFVRFHSEKSDLSYLYESEPEKYTTNYHNIISGSSTPRGILFRGSIDLSEKMSFKNIILINLTETFGEGNEPSAEQMNRILSQFPDSWFDGTQTITKEFMIMLLKEMNGIRNVQKAMLGDD